MTDLITSGGRLRGRVARPSVGREPAANHRLRARSAAPLPATARRPRLYQSCRRDAKLRHFVRETGRRVSSANVSIFLNHF